MKAAIHTLGCKVNIYESEYITNILKENGYQIVDFDSKADIYIINTCTVTNTSDKKSEKMIKRARKQNKDAIIIAMGCHAQIKGDNIDADIIIGNKDKSKIISLIEEYQENKNKIKRIYNLDNVSFEDMYISSFNSHTRAFVKIQDGCDAFCSYCIIPYARGPIRSKDPKTVIKEITSLVENGYKEIILTGIHTGKYGKDINYTFEQLLKEIIKIKNLYRIRISSIEINELTDPILDLIKDNKIIAKHLHIPLQSGSDKILKLMDRKYDLKFYKDRIEKIRKMIKDVSITTDLIVGFPNEDEKDMEDTLKFIKEIKFTKIHTFPYSKREGTKAASMENQIDETIKRKRVKTVLELSDQLEQDFYQSKLNETEEVIIEQTKDGKSYGYTSNYIKVEIDSPLKPNEVISVKINKVNNKKVTGKII
ncbi:MAG: tRNA (N(6)-L-threonylcarbamoyladenosine(37)-C(2))-methylthiotransferase MtaB [Bacilli bacterium]